MKMRICRLEKQNMAAFKGHIPPEVRENIDREGYYTLGAVFYPDGKRILAGMIQVFVDATLHSGSYAELIHVYVEEPFRRQSVGLRLVGAVDDVLASASVNVIIARVIPYFSKDTNGSLPKHYKEDFLTECGFLSTTDNMTGLSGEVETDPMESRFIKFTGR